jgi:GTP:adenosylcobinamide-phosphate guanylyltransferase
MLVIILAAARTGQIDPLAAEHGTPLKCLVPIAGYPLIAHVVRAVAANPSVTAMRIVVERESIPAVKAVTRLVGHVPIDFIPAQPTLADSVIAAMAEWDAPALITTADNVLLAPDSLDAMRDALRGADVALAMARRQSVLNAHPDGQRRFYGFTDDHYSNCNLYGLAGPHALQAAEAFRGGGQFAKKATRIVSAFGLINLILFRLGRLSLDGAMARISRRMGLTIQPVILADGRHAIDVDNARTYGVAAQLLAER